MHLSNYSILIFLSIVMQISSLNVHMHVGLQRFFNILLMMIKNLLRACNHRNSKQCGYHGNMPLYMCVVCHPDRNMLHTVKGRAQQCGHAPPTGRVLTTPWCLRVRNTREREPSGCMAGTPHSKLPSLARRPARRIVCLAVCLAVVLANALNNELATSTSRALRHWDLTIYTWQSIQCSIVYQRCLKNLTESSAKGGGGADL